MTSDPFRGWNDPRDTNAGRESRPKRDELDGEPDGRTTRGAAFPRDPPGDRSGTSPEALVAFAADDGPFADDTAAGSGPAAASYWTLSRTPLTSLVFTLPLVAAYEGGVLLLGRGSPRNGADVWLRELLETLGFGQYFLLPLATLTGLLAWQFLAHDRWKLSLAVLPGMVAESVLWAVVLVGVGRLQQSVWPLDLAAGAGWFLDVGPPGFGAGWRGIAARVVGYCGAGLYEEVLFRLLLLPIGVWLFGRLGCGPVAAGGWALAVSSLLFSAAHYVGPLGDTFEIGSFTFRAIAGMLFAVLFLVRGFGIAAGSHFFYDLLVGLV